MKNLEFSPFKKTNNIQQKFKSVQDFYVMEDMNAKFRPYMEDKHAFID